MTISVSEEFLADAVYPVSVDPTVNIDETDYDGTLIEDNAVYSDFVSVLICGSISDYTATQLSSLFGISQ